MAQKRKTTAVTYDRDEASQKKQCATSFQGISNPKRDIVDSLPIFGLLTCAVLAVILPRLQVIPLRLEQIPEVNWHTDAQPLVVNFSSSDLQERILPDFEQRRENATVEAALEAAVMGAFLADAASLGFHGLYDTNRMHKLLHKDDGKESPPEFFRPLELEYKATKGSFSAYAYEVLPLMHTLLSHNHLEPDQFANDSLAFLRGFRGHSNALMRDFASNSKRGLKGPDAAGTTDQAHSLIKVPLVVARYAGHDELAEKVAAVIGVHQTNEDATLAGLMFSAILERMTLLGASLQEAMEWAVGQGSLPERGRQWVAEALQQRQEDASEALEQFGRGQRAVSVLQSGLYVALSADSYVDGVRSSILAGGDTTSRAHVVGALLAAQHGETSLPKKWRKKTTKFMDVKQMVHVIIVQRTQFVPFFINRDPRQQPDAPRNATFA